MKNKKMHLRSLPYLILVFGLILPLGIVGPSCAVPRVSDDGVTTRMSVERLHPPSITTLSTASDFAEVWQSGDIGEVTCIVIEDIDRDGVTEIVVGTVTGFDGNPYTYHGYVYVFSALTHGLEWRSDDIGYVTRIIVTDLDDDGSSEILARTYCGRSAIIGDCYGYVHVFDAVSHTQIWKSDNIGQGGGLAVADLDGDGTKEIITGAMHYYSCLRKGHIYVFDGADFRLIWKSADVNSPGIIEVDDLDGDGVNEIIFGNCITDCASSGAEGGFYYPGHINILNGVDFSQRWKSGDIGSSQGFVIVDVDDDGVKEILAGVARTSSPNTEPDRGYVYAFDGETYTQKWRSSNLNYPHVSVADLDGDGTKEIIARTLVGHWIHTGVYEGHLYIFDGATFGQVWRSDNLGVDASLEVVDLDNDGTKEILTRNTIGGGGYLCIFNGVTYEEEWRSDNIGRGALAAADLNGNGIKEIVAGGSTEAYHGRLYVFASSEGPEPSQYSLTISSTDGGSVTEPGEGTSTYENGTVVDLVAEADVGYEFVNWTGDVGTITNINSASTSITMNGNYSITASFGAIAGVQTACAESATGTGEVCITTSHGFIEDLKAIPPHSLPSVLFPHGMFDFRIRGLTPGQTVTLTIEFPSPLPIGTLWWKYDNGRWHGLPNENDNGDHIMVIKLTDGGIGDLDNIPGQITDPGGPGNPMTVGWETYPVNKVHVLLPWIVFFVAVVASMSILMLRRRRS